MNKHILIKSYKKNQIKLINNMDKKEWIKSLYNTKKFLFIYNEIANSNYNPGHNIKILWQE